MVERSKQRDHYALYLKWPSSSETLVSLVDDDSVKVQLHMAVDKRGWFNPGRLLLESTYPLGLLRCWTWIDLDLRAMVYPRPLASAELPGLATDRPDGAAAMVVGNDDFYGFRKYRKGDSLRQVHWKGLAKGQGVQTKQYTAYADRSVWLDWDLFPGMGTEQRLSHLCYWVLEFDRRREEYGLRLPGVVIEPAVGDKHRDRVLKELALYGKEGRGSVNILQQVPRNALVWIIICQFALVAPHAGRLPVWVLAVYVVAVVWRLQVHRGRWSFPGRWVKVALTVLQLYRSLCQLRFPDWP